MESTVHPERKLMVATLARPSISSIGLMITPPPMPQIAPAMDAKKLTQKNKIELMRLFLLRYVDFDKFIIPFWKNAKLP